MRPMGPELLEWARQSGLFEPEDLELMQATYEAESARQVRLAEWRAGKHAAGESPLQDYGRPIDWAHDGTEHRGAATEGYRCPLCRDARFLRRDVSPGDPDFGRAIPCRCQTEDPESRRRLLARRSQRAGLPPELQDKTLGQFRGIQGAQEALNAAQQFIDGLTRGEPALWLVLMGMTGSGKSHLGAAITHGALLRGEAFWADTRDLLQACRAHEFERDEALTTLASTAPVLVLDEFGSQQDVGDWSRVKLETILQARWTARLPTVVVLTLTPDALEEWSPRLNSRLHDRSRVRWVALTCGDYRRKLRAPQATDGAA